MLDGGCANKEGVCLKEVLINSGSTDLLSERVQIKAQSALIASLLARFVTQRCAFSDARR